jgi:hypothetical protein
MADEAVGRPAHRCQILRSRDGTTDMFSTWDEGQGVMSLRLRLAAAALPITPVLSALI